MIRFAFTLLLCASALAQDDKAKLRDFRDQFPADDE